MIMNVEKEIFKNLFTKENIIKINDIGEIWDNRWLIIYSLIQDGLAKHGFSPDGDRYSYKNINKKISLTFIYDPDYKKFRDDYLFGFSYENLQKKEKDILENILTEFIHKNILADEVEYFDDWLIVKRLYIDLYQPYEEIIEKIIELSEKLEKEIKKIKNVK